MSRKPYGNNLISKYSAQGNNQFIEDNINVRKSFLLRPHINTHNPENPGKRGNSKERKRAITEYRKGSKESKGGRRNKKEIIREEEDPRRKLKAKEQIETVDELRKAEEDDEFNKNCDEKIEIKLNNQGVKNIYADKDENRNKNSKCERESYSKSFSDEDSKLAEAFKGNKGSKEEINCLNNREIKGSSYDSNNRVENSKDKGKQRLNTSHNNEIISIPINQLENLIHYYNLALQPNPKEKLSNEKGKISLNISFKEDSTNKDANNNTNQKKGNQDKKESSKIDDIIKKNLRKEREKFAVENSKRIEMEKKHKEAKIRLAKINEEIKMKNAYTFEIAKQNNDLSSKRRNGTSKEGNKSRTMYKSIDNRSQKHREMIGMEYVDLRKKSSGRKNPKNHSTVEAPENYLENKITKKNIRKFMKQKQSKMNKQLKESKEKKKKDQEKKSKNLDKLKNYIKNQRKADPIKIQKKIPQIKINSDEESDNDDSSKNENIYREYQSILNDIHQQEKMYKKNTSQRSQSSSPKEKLNSYEERKEAIIYKSESEERKANRKKVIKRSFCPLNHNLENLEELTIVSFDKENIKGNKIKAIEDAKVNENVREIQIKQINPNVNDISISIDKLNSNYSKITQEESKYSKNPLKNNLNLSFDVCQEIGKLSFNHSTIHQDNSDIEPSKPIISLNELKNLQFFQDRLELNIIGKKIGEKRNTQIKSASHDQSIEIEQNEDNADSNQDDQFENSNKRISKNIKGKNENKFEKNPKLLKELNEEEKIILNPISKNKNKEKVHNSSDSSKISQAYNQLENIRSNIHLGKVYKLSNLNNHNIFETISINPHSDLKEIPKSKNFEIQTEELYKSLNGNSNLNEKLQESSSLSGFRAYFGSEKKIRDASNDILKQPISPHSSQAIKNFQNEIHKYRSSSERNDSLESLIENNLINIEKSLNHQKLSFGKNSFDIFSLRKFKELLNEDNMSKIIIMREKLLKVKAKKEKKLINAKLKSNEYSPKTYFRMHMELEKWVDKEKKEITKSRQELIENWKKTANLINETHQNIIRTKQLISNKTPHFASEANSERSLGFDSLESNELTLRGSKDELFQMQDSIESRSLKRDKSFGHLNEINSAEVEENGINKKNNDNNQSAIKVEPDFLLDKSNEISKDEENSVNSNQNDLIYFSPINPNLKFDNGNSIDHKKLLSDPLSSKIEKGYGISGIFKPEMNEGKESKSAIDRSKELFNGQINLNLVNSSDSKGNSLFNHEQFERSENSEKSGASDRLNTFNAEDNYGISEKVIGRNNRNLLNNKEEICKPLNIQQKASQISDLILKELINELSNNLYPIRSNEQILYSFDIKGEKASDKTRIPMNEKNKENDSKQEIEQDFLEKKILMQSLNKKNGINTDPASLEKLLDHIFSEVTKNSTSFLNKLQMPIPKEFLRILNDLQISESNLIQQQFLPHELFPILSNQCFIELQKNNSNFIKHILQEHSSQSSLLSEVDPKSPEFLKECEFIHNKAVYDSVNECLNLMRPYGLNGEPLPWSCSVRIIQNKLPKIENVFSNIKNIIQEWCSIEAGTLPKPEFVINNKFDDEYFAETREKRLGAVLSQEIIDN